MQATTARTSRGWVVLRNNQETLVASEEMATQLARFYNTMAKLDAMEVRPTMVETVQIPKHEAVELVMALGTLASLVGPYERQRIQALSQKMSNRLHDVAQTNTCPECGHGERGRDKLCGKCWAHFAQRRVNA